jgi:hypothetical protein
MERERSGKFLLAGLVVVLIGVLVWTWRNQSAIPLPASNESAPRGQSTRRARSGGAGGLDVHLKALNAPHTKPAEGVRNLFRYKTKPAPPPPPPRASAAPPPSTPAAPPGPPPAPPIALKFIGLVVQTSDKSQRVAVLSDGRGPVPIYGKEGDIIEGRYRIVRIGAESIELAYLDGRGRQTIRLTGG